MRSPMKAQLASAMLAPALASCASLPPPPELPNSAAIEVGVDARLDALFRAAELDHPDASGFRLVADGPEAFALRAGSAALAERSIDVQTYIWHADLTGLYLAHALIEAADRGVRVRLLLDDLDARAKNEGLLALDAHEQIEVRLFHPFASRSGAWGFIGEFMRSFRRLNRRMHIKNWIADNRIAIAGGRNIGDEYFAASAQTQFTDLEYAMAGPIVRELSAAFDAYWNSKEVYPIRVLDERTTDDAPLIAVRERLASTASAAYESEYARALRQHEPVRRLAQGDWPLSWIGAYELASDEPVKAVDSNSSPSAVLNMLRPRIEKAEREVLIVSPYFVPGRAGADLLADLAQRGVNVRILTNSLAANDVAAVHGGYARYREDLLRSGVELWELKPRTEGFADMTLLGSAGASLHSKALSIDGRAAFVGSYNLDPRSTQLNNEQGVLVHDEALGAQFDDLFRQQTAPTHAWRVRLQDDALHWSDDEHTYTRDPLASFGRRLLAWFARVLPVEPML